MPKLGASHTALMRTVLRLGEGGGPQRVPSLMRAACTPPNRHPSLRHLVSGIWLALFLVPAAAMSVRAEQPVVFDTDSFRVQISHDGLLRSLVGKPGGIDYARIDPPAPVAVVYRGGQSAPVSEGKYAAATGRWEYRGGESFASTRAVFSKDELKIDFGKANVTAVYHVSAFPHFLVFELTGLTGEPIDRIDLIRLNITGLPRVGTWINLARSEDFAVCLCAGNVATHAEADVDGADVSLRAIAEKEPGLVGAVAVLLACPNPDTTFLDAMSAVERELHLPPGADNRRKPGQRLSYLWPTDPTPDNIEQYIEVAKRGGFRMILFSYTAFSSGAGHFEWKPSFPGGMVDLRRMTDSIRGAGLKVGLHLHYSKAHRKDAYVTPVPDPRLHIVRQFTLAADVDADAETIPVEQDPEGCTLDDERRILRAGRELIYYTNYRTAPYYAFTGCQRGYLGTTAGVHQKGNPAGLLNVDTWPSFVRFDQTTDIQDEVAGRIAAIFRETGPYEMVYFDGAEDVHGPFWYNVALAQERVFRQLDVLPTVTEAPHYTNFSWHMITRSNAYDTVAPADGMKDFCRLMPCPTAAARVNDFSRVDFGWLGRFGKSKAGCAGPDVLEYIVSRAAAWDCPISLKVTLKGIASHPRRDDCFAVLKTWEDARLANALTKSQIESLKNVPPEAAEYVSCYRQREIWENCRDGVNLTRAQKMLLSDRREHHLFTNEQGQYELVLIEEIPNVAGGAVKAYCFHRASRPRDTYILLWAVEGEVVLRLPVSPRQLSAMRPFGNAIQMQGQTDTTLVEVGGRMYLVLPDSDFGQVERLLGQARVVGGASAGGAGEHE